MPGSFAIPRNSGQTFLDALAHIGHRQAWEMKLWRLRWDARQFEVPAVTDRLFTWRTANTKGGNSTAYRKAPEWEKTDQETVSLGNDWHPACFSVPTHLMPGNPTPPAVIDGCVNPCLTVLDTHVLRTINSLMQRFWLSWNDYQVLEE